MHCVICLKFHLLLILGMDPFIVIFWLSSVCLVVVIDTLFFVANVEFCCFFFPYIFPTVPVGNVIIAS